ncbi:hypothetical protein SAMN05443245_6876 [Paraburkholderia fungorum]|uniref:Uncharacterized protein n=1 Tax=Paraburkholderia fungorum TaxID=134537 RepID=A0A1H1JMM1_9BURK|nr:hypothetical protein [Paraburkholderia fungorum]SDR51256.1 hypothetical protein SAMN05443245_6876 [Paraburkholderia fungorum]
MRNNSQKVPPPGYTTSKILFPALNILNEELGFQDSAIQLAELAARILGEQAVASDFGIGDFLAREFNARSIPHGTHDLVHLARFSHQSYIVQTYGTIEKVLKQLSQELRAHKWIDERWKSVDNNGETYSPAEALAENLPAAAGKLLRTTPEFELLEYYRLLRVSIVHQNEETIRRSASAYKKLEEKHGKYFRSTYGLDAPNDKDDLSFADFCIFTRSIKYFANVINEACDLQIGDVVSYIKLRDRSALEILQLPKTKQLGALRMYVRNSYKISAEQLSTLDHSMVRYLRERRALTDLVKELNQKDRKRETSVRVARSESYTIERVEKCSKSERKNVEIIDDLSVSETIVFVSELIEKC